MPSLEREFLHRRLAIVERNLARPSDYVYDGDSRGHLRRPSETGKNITLERERRLLFKLLDKVPEGRVVTTLVEWRKEFGKKWQAHRQNHSEMQEAYDTWWQLPFYRRVRVPQPPRPPSLRITDHKGHVWIIDDRYLGMVDDLVERLNKWLTAER